MGFTTVQHAFLNLASCSGLQLIPQIPLSLLEVGSWLDSTWRDRHGYVKPSKPSARLWSTSRTFSTTTVSMVFSPGYWRPNWARATTSLGARTHNKPTTQVARSMQVDCKMNWLRPGSYPAPFCSRSQAVTGPKCETRVFVDQSSSSKGKMAHGVWLVKFRSWRSATPTNVSATTTSTKEKVASLPSGVRHWEGESPYYHFVHFQTILALTPSLPY